MGPIRTTSWVLVITNRGHIIYHFVVNLLPRSLGCLQALVCVCVSFNSASMRGEEEEEEGEE